MPPSFKLVELEIRHDRLPMPLESAGPAACVASEMPPPGSVCHAPQFRGEGVDQGAMGGSASGASRGTMRGLLSS